MSCAQPTGFGRYIVINEIPKKRTIDLRDRKGGNFPRIQFFFRDYLVVHSRQDFNDWNDWNNRIYEKFYFL